MSETRSRNLVGLLSALLFVPLMAGCGGSSGIGSGGVAASGLKGKVNGGGAQNPITGSNVTLYAMSNTSDGAPPTTLSSTTSDGGGAFSFGTYTCPSATTQTYVVATSGDAGSGTNTAIGLMALTGPCGDLTASTFVTVNELTTAAAQWALAQFADSTGTNFGSSSTNATGLNNAVNLAMDDLAVACGGATSGPCSNVTSPNDTNTGIPASFLPWSSTQTTCTSTAPTSNCGGLERLGTLANILAACVNSAGPSSTACSTLFTNTSVSTSATTLAIAHAIVTKPTANVSSIYGVQGTPGSAPYQPNLTSAPADFTLGLNFSPNAANFNSPLAIAIDASGNVWVTNQTGNSVTKLDPTGSSASNYAPTGANFNQPVGVAIDASGNAWIANEGNNTVTKLDPTGSSASNYAPTGASFNVPFGVAIDASGNVWVTNNSGNSVTKLAASGSSATNYTSSSPSGANFNGPVGVTIDASGNVWVPNQNNSTVTKLAASGSSATNYTSSSPSGTNFNQPYDIAIDASGNVWITNYNGSTVTKLAASGSSASNYAPSGASLINPIGIAIDASGNAWIISNDNNAVSEINSSGSAGFNYAPTGANISSPFYSAIDASGNVWITNNTNNTVSELVGLAAPVKTPLVACLASGVAVCAP